MIKIKITIKKKRDGERGALLMSCLILLPIALATFVLVMTRIDIGMREARRHHERVQARLLAESAWAVAKTDPRAIPAPGGNQVEGRLDGIGIYRISTSTMNGQRILLARGEVENDGSHSGAASHSPRVIAELIAVLSAKSSGSSDPIPLRFTCRVDSGAK